MIMTSILATFLLATTLLDVDGQEWPEFRKLPPEYWLADEANSGFGDLFMERDDNRI